MVRQFHRSKRAILEDVSEIIRAVYIQYYSTKQSGEKNNQEWRPTEYWDGGEWHGQKRPNIWMAAAKKVLKHRLPVGEFVYYVIFCRGTSKVAPNHLLSDRVIDGFKQYRISIQNNIRAELKSNLENDFRELRTSVVHAEESRRCSRKKRKRNKTALQREILLDETLAMSGLFRYAIASREGLHDIAEEYELQALLEYMSHCDEYDIVWGDLIPRSLKTMAKKLCEA